MYETTTLGILMSLIEMSAKYDCQDIRSEVLKHLMKEYPDNIADFDKEKTTELFSDPPEDYNFQLLSVAHKLDEPLVLPLMYYRCAIRPLDFIFKASGNLPKVTAERIISGREKLMKFSYEAGTAALLPQTKCRSFECVEKRAALLVQHFGNTTFDPPTFALEMTDQGIFAIDGGKHAEICKPCIRNYKEALKGVREDLWGQLPVIFLKRRWDKLQ